MKVLFLGSGPFALPSLEALGRLSSRHPLCAVISRPDRPARRGLKPRPTPVGRRATELGLKRFNPGSANDPEFLDRLRLLGADLCIVADYGEILREEFLEVPRIGTFNLHASLLPRHRGAAPVAHAILADEKVTGVTLFRVERSLDSGPVISRAELPIRDDETAGELEARLSRVAAELLEKSLEALASAAFTETPQDHALATRAPKLEKEMGLIDWDEAPRVVRNKVRAFNPWPMACSFLHRAGRRPERVSILRVDIGEVPRETAGPGCVVQVTKETFHVACQGGSIAVREIQRAGKVAVTSADFLNGCTLKVGDRFLRHEERENGD